MEMRFVRLLHNKRLTKEVYECEWWEQITTEDGEEYVMIILKETFQGKI